MADGRPQDEGRPHRRTGRPSAETATLLGRYREAMRSELHAVLDELGPAVPDRGLLEDAGLPAAPPKRPPLTDRIRLWDLAIKLGRELGTEVDPGPPPGEAPAAAPSRRRRRVDYGGS